MTKPVLAPACFQGAWNVRDLAAAEKFFVETMGISRFMSMDKLAATDTEGTYLGNPQTWSATFASLTRGTPRSN
jgi:extradiol dioxygenase family protein